MLRTTLLALLSVSLALLPAGTALASGGEDESIVCQPLTVSRIVECAVGLVVGVITYAHGKAQCVLGVPPGAYPDGLLACFPEINPLLP